MARRRMQRAILCTRVLTPYNVEDAMGQALLRITVRDAARPRHLFRAGHRVANASSAPGATDLLEGFFVLPGRCVALLSNQQILLLYAPEFCAICDSLRAGNSVAIDALAPGTLASPLIGLQSLCVCCACAFAEAKCEVTRYISDMTKEVFESCMRCCACAFPEAKFEVMRHISDLTKDVFESCMRWWWLP